MPNADFILLFVIVVPQLFLPGEICDRINPFLVEGFENVPRVNVLGDECDDGLMLERVQAGGDEFSELLELREIEEIPIVERVLRFLLCLLFYVYLRVECPHDVGDGCYDLRGVEEHPLFAFFHFEVGLAEFNLSSEGLPHLILDGEEPLLYLAFRWEELVEVDDFLLGGDHASHHVRCVDVESVDAVEAFLEIALDCFDVAGFGEDFDELVVGEEVESRELPSLVFEVVVEGFLDVVEGFLVFAPGFEGFLGVHAFVDELDLVCLAHERFEVFVDHVELGGLFAQL